MYWEKIAHSLSGSRHSRRRILTGLGAATGAAAFSWACGADSKDSSPADRSGLLAKAEDTTSRATPGGIWQDYLTADAPSLDPLTTTSFRVYNEAILVYSLLLRNKIGPASTPPLGEVEGDAAESWEYSPDGMQLTLKLRSNHKFDPRPPTNGRPLDVNDVKWSWDRYVASSPYAVDVAYARNPAAAVTSLQTPDARTVVLKLAYPWADLLEALAYNWFLYLMPVEAEDKFNPRSDMRGTGPFMLSRYQPSVIYELRKNPNWYEKDRPFLDGINRPIISEYATGLSQFKAGNLWAFTARPEDVVQTKRDHADMVMLADAAFTNHVTHFLTFSAQSNSSFLDPRPRRAASMLMDRDAWIDTFFNVSGFEKEGLPVVTRWHSHVGNGAPGWLDPKGKGLGEGARYFQHDPTEAKKLLSAAGFKPDVPFIYFTSGEHGSQTPKYHEVFTNMLNEGSFGVKANTITYPSWGPVCLFGKGDFDGMCYSSRSGFNLGDFITGSFTSTGKWALSTNPKTFQLEKAEPLVNRYRAEFDPKKRTEIVEELQKELALQMPCVPFPGSALGFTLRWPWFANHGSLGQGGASARLPVAYWYDASKKKA